MNSIISSYSIFPLGDSAVTLSLGEKIDRPTNEAVLTIGHWLNCNRPDGISDIIIAYNSVSVFYDPVEIHAKATCLSGASSFIQDWLQTALHQILFDTATTTRESSPDSPVFSIPVCYGGDFGPDLPFVAREKGISPQEVVKLHQAACYRVYMVRFLPVHVPAGGVGIAGSQTGVYPLNSPGGWQIIVRTPLSLFNATKKTPVLLTVGDLVRFYPISNDVFDRMTSTP